MGPVDRTASWHRIGISGANLTLFAGISPTEVEAHTKNFSPDWVQPFPRSQPLEVAADQKRLDAFRWDGADCVGFRAQPPRESVRRRPNGSPDVRGGSDVRAAGIQCARILLVHRDHSVRIQNGVVACKRPEHLVLVFCSHSLWQISFFCESLSLFLSSDWLSSFHLLNFFFAGPFAKI